MIPRSLLLAAIALSTAATAQTDTTSATERRTTLAVGVNSRDGAYAKVEDSDTTKKSDGHFTIETKRKRITVHTEPRNWASESDSIASIIKERRTERRNMFTYWSGIDLGVNTLIDESGSPDLGGNAEFMEIDNARSRFVSINFMEQKIELCNHHMGLLTGLGWEFVNYRLKNNVTLAYDADSVYGVEMETPDLRKNKLRQMGIRVPLMLEFNTKRARMPAEADIRAMRADSTGALAKQFKHSRKHNFHFAMGMIGSWYFDSMYKQKWTEDGEMRKARDKGDYLLLPYRAAASVRLGYGAWNLFAEYSLTPLFKEGKGPELTPVTVGLTIVGFN